MMHFLQADVVFPVHSPPIINGILCVDEAGTILDVIGPADTGSIPDSASIQHFTGFICPGFINGHGHLELSYLKGIIPEHTGLPGFLGNIIAHRNTMSSEQIGQAIANAESEMIRNGIVAAADISNGPDTFACKAQNHLHYHTFLELFDLDESKAEDAWQRGLQLYSAWRQSGPASHTCSLVPHAPYSVSAKLLALIRDFAQEHHSLLTIHNQESASENELFIGRHGSLFNFFNQAGYHLDFISPTGKTSIHAVIPGLAGCNKLLLVHNTYSSQEDVAYAAKEFPETWWCFCPNANLYIENRIPDIQNFRHVFNHILLGTDSLASNHRLCILEEMKTILTKNPWLTLQEVLPWATWNGAQFLGLQNRMGSFEKGNQPGINLLENVDSSTLSITRNTTVRKLF